MLLWVLFPYLKRPINEYKLLSKYNWYLNKNNYKIMLLLFYLFYKIHGNNANVFKSNEQPKDFDDNDHFSRHWNIRLNGHKVPEANYLIKIKKKKKKKKIFAIINVFLLIERFK